MFCIILSGQVHQKPHVSFYMIRNATVIFLEKAAQTHVLVQDGRIASIDAAPNTTADEVYDRS